jgi:hypothetical protein
MTFGPHLRSLTWKAFPYDRIDLERTACFGMCPAYRVSLFRGGRAESHVTQYTERLGDFEGKVTCRTSAG